MAKEEFKRPASPFYQDLNLNLPRERAEVNAWTRHYNATHPLISTWIDEIISQVYSGFAITKKSNMSEKDYDKIQGEFFDSEGKFKFEGQSYDIVKELNLSGESIPHLELDEDKGSIANVIVLNADYVQIKKNPLAGVEISLIPDDELKRVIASKDKKDKKLVKQLDKDIVNLVKEGKPIPLSPSLVSHLSMKNHAYDVRGTSILIKLFKALMNEDRIREKAYEERESPPETTEVLREIIRMCKTKAFKERLKKQRKMLEKWINERLFRAYKKMHKIKGDVFINWKEKIDMGSFERMLEGSK